MMEWGRHYAMVRPDHFRVDYVINPFMDPADQPDPQRALDQWEHLAAAIETAGGRVDVLGQRADAPDMVYAMNLGLALVRSDEPHVVMSHMRYAERRVETGTARDWFARQGFTTSYVGRDGVGPHLEAGDAFAWGDALVVGFGPRTDEAALPGLAADLGVRVRGFRIAHPGMYHLDLAFCPLDERRAMVCPSAFSADDAEALLALVPEPLVLSEAEALTFCANSIVVGRTVIMPACPDRVRAILEGWDFTIVILELTEFHKGGGSARCLTNPLDLTLGRDLPVVPGGEVILVDAPISAVA